MLRPLLNNAYFHDLHDKAEQFGIEVEGHHTETGPGVFEVRRRREGLSVPTSLSSLTNVALRRPPSATRRLSAWPIMPSCSSCWPRPPVSSTGSCRRLWPSRTLRFRDAAVTSMSRSRQLRARMPLPTPAARPAAGQGLPSRTSPSCPRLASNSSPASFAACPTLCHSCVPTSIPTSG